jgi:hypothetical protein
MISNILVCKEEKKASLDNTYYKWKHNFLGTKIWKKSLDTFLTQTQNWKICANNLFCAQKKIEAITLHMRISNNYVKVNYNKYFFLVWLHVFFL